MASDSLVNGGLGNKNKIGEVKVGPATDKPAASTQLGTKPTIPSVPDDVDPAKGDVKAKPSTPIKPTIKSGKLQLKPDQIDYSSTIKSEALQSKPGQFGYTSPKATGGDAGPVTTEKSGLLRRKQPVQAAGEVKITSPSGDNLRAPVVSKPDAENTIKSDIKAEKAPVPPKGKIPSSGTLKTGAGVALGVGVVGAGYSLYNGDNVGAAKSVAGAGAGWGGLLVGAKIGGQIPGPFWLKGGAAVVGGLLGAVGAVPVAHSAIDAVMGDSVPVTPEKMKTANAAMQEYFNATYRAYHASTPQADNSTTQNAVLQSSQWKNANKAVGAVDQTMMGGASSASVLRSITETAKQAAMDDRKAGIDVKAGLAKAQKAYITTSGTAIATIDDNKPGQTSHRTLLAHAQERSNSTAPAQKIPLVGTTQDQLMQAAILEMTAGNPLHYQQTAKFINGAMMHAQRREEIAAKQEKRAVKEINADDVLRVLQSGMAGTPNDADPKHKSERLYYTMAMASMHRVDKLMEGQASGKFKTAKPITDADREAFMIEARARAQRVTVEAADAKVAAQKAAAAAAAATTGTTTPPPAPVSAMQALIDKANAGDIEAMKDVGANFMDGLDGFPKDEAKGFQATTTAANAGNAVAQYNLGIAYLKGKGTAVDRVQAYKYFMLAFNAGDQDAKAQLEKMQATAAEIDAATPLIAAFKATPPVVVPPAPQNSVAATQSQSNSGSTGTAATPDPDAAATDTPAPKALRAGGKSGGAATGGGASGGGAGLPAIDPNVQSALQQLGQSTGRKNSANFASGGAMDGLRGQATNDAIDWFKGKFPEHKDLPLGQALYDAIKKEGGVAQAKAMAAKANARDAATKGAPASTTATQADAAGQGGTGGASTPAAPAADAEYTMAVDALKTLDGAAKNYSMGILTDEAVQRLALAQFKDDKGNSLLTPEQQKSITVSGGVVSSEYFKKAEEYLGFEADGKMDPRLQAALGNPKIREKLAAHFAGKAISGGQTATAVSAPAVTGSTVVATASIGGASTSGSAMSGMTPDADGVTRMKVVTADGVSTASGSTTTTTTKIAVGGDVRATDVTSQQIISTATTEEAQTR